MVATSARARLLELGAAVVALAATIPVVWAVGAAIAARVDYPGDLEWMEGATLMSALRAHDGLGLYDAPTPEYIPFIYPPLYAWIVGTLGHVVPLGYTLGRSVSVVGSLSAAVALVFGARREGASWPLSLATVGLFAACWDDSGSFFDLVRTDGLSIGLLSWALVLAPQPGVRAPVAAGAILAVAFMAKQHVALFGVPLLGWLWMVRGRQVALRFAATSVGISLAFVAGMALATSGRFVVWLVAVPAVHGQSASRLFPGAQLECWHALPITTTVALLTLPWWAKRRSYWALVAGAALIVVSLMRGHTGGYLNVLIPMMWVQCLLPVIAASAFGGRAAWGVAGLLVALQGLGWNTNWTLLGRRLSAGQAPWTAWADAQLSVSKYVPTEADRRQVVEFVDELRDLPDPILIPHGPWYAVLAGKTPSFALISLWDIDHAHGPYLRDVKRIDGAIAKDFPVAVVPNDDLNHGFKAGWVLDHRLPVACPSTRTGWPVTLRMAYRPKGAPPLGVKRSPVGPATLPSTPPASAPPPTEPSTAPPASPEGR